MPESWIIERKEQVGFLSENLLTRINDGGVVSLDIKSGRARTSRQQAALEVWCRTVAKEFNDAGITREVKSSIFKEGSLEIPWTRASVKDEIWRPIQIWLTEKESTTEPTTDQYVTIYNVLVNAFGGKGIELPAWPLRPGA